MNIINRFKKLLGIASPSKEAIAKEFYRREGVLISGVDMAKDRDATAFVFSLPGPIQFEHARMVMRPVTLNPEYRPNWDNVEFRRISHPAGWCTPSRFAITDDAVLYADDVEIHELDARYIPDENEAIEVPDWPVRIPVEVE